MELPSTAKADIERFVKELFSEVIPYKQKTGRFPVDEKGQECLGGVFTGGHHIFVYVVDPKNTGDSGCAYNPTNDTITISREILNSPETVRRVILHELTHAVDPKTQFPQPAEYPQWSQRKDPRYFQHPTEFDAYGANFADNLRGFLLNIKSSTQRQKVIDRIKNWLRRGSPAFLPPTDFLDDRIQNYIVGYLPKVQPAWRQNPKLWQMFQQRVYNVLDKLTAWS